MATQTWTGSGRSASTGWSPGSTADGDTFVIDEVALPCENDLSAQAGTDAALVRFTRRATANFGTETEGFEIDADRTSTGLVVNEGKSPLIHLKGGTTGVVYRVLHRGTGKFILSGATGNAVEASSGQFTLSGDSLPGEVAVNGTCFADLRRGSEAGLGSLIAAGRSQTDCARSISTSCIIADRGQVKQTYEGMTWAGVKMYGGKLTPLGGQLTEPTLLGGVLDLSQLVDDLAITVGGTWGQDLVIIPPPADVAVNISGTPRIIGRPPANFPGNWS